MKGFNSLCYVKSVLQELQIPLSYMKDKGIWLTKNSRSLSLKNIITTWYIFFPLVKQTWEKEPPPKNPTPHQHSFKDILESWISAFGFFGGGSWGVLIVCLFVLLGRFIRWNGGWKRKIKERKRKKKEIKIYFLTKKTEYIMVCDLVPMILDYHESKWILPHLFWQYLYYEWHYHRW